jgi:hypothetical protein
MAGNFYIKNEGEVQTVSTTTVWLDVDGDGVADASEPQTSFSKITQPQHNISQDFTLNVASTSAGTYAVRSITTYSNSAESPSTASDTVIVTTCSSSSGSGAGGGGGSVLAVKPSTVVILEKTIQETPTVSLKDAKWQLLLLFIPIVIIIIIMRRNGMLQTLMQGFAAHPVVILIIFGLLFIFFLLWKLKML